MNGLVRIIQVAFLIYIVILLLPTWHELVTEATIDAPTHLRVLVLFAFDPLEYVWKWLIVLVGLAFHLYRRD